MTLPTGKRNREQTKERILDAAVAEFANHGLGGARVDAIAERANANKAMLYHYYGNKEDLFLTVLERAYESIRQHESEIDLRDQDPEAAIRRLVEATFTYYVEHPELIRLLNNENLYRAAHIQKSSRVPDLHSPLIRQIRRVLDQGSANGQFRTGVDPLQLYISIAALGYYYLSNAYTLSAIFKCDLTAPEALRDRFEHNVEVILGYLRCQRSN